MNKNLYLILFSLLFFGLIVYFYVLPNWDVASQAKDELATWQTKLKDAQDIKQKLPALQEKYQALKDEEDKIMQAVPNLEDLPGLLVQAEALASQNGLILNSISFAHSDNNMVKNVVPSAPNEALNIKNTSPTSSNQGSVSESVGTVLPSTVSTLSVSLSLNGNYANLKNFLHETENNLRLADVSAVSFAGEPAKGAPKTTDMAPLKINIDFYYKK